MSSADLSTSHLMKRERSFQAEKPSKRQRTKNSLSHVADWLDQQGRRNQRRWSEPDLRQHTTQKKLQTSITDEIGSCKRQKHAQLTPDSLSVHLTAPLTSNRLRELDPNAPAAPSTTSLTDSPSTIMTSISEPGNAINAYSASFPSELGIRGILLVEDDENPSDVDAFTQVVKAERSCPGPDKQACRELEHILRDICNEPSAMQAILPEYLPIRELWHSSDLWTGADIIWDKSAVSHFNRGRSTPLKKPKPDQTIGFKDSTFTQRETLVSCRQYSYTTQSSRLVYPVFAVEGKGDKGTLKVSRNQNLWNGAVMLHNLLQTARLAEAEEEFYNKIQVVTMSITTETIEINYHWAKKQELQGVQYLSRSYARWTVGERDFAEAQRNVLNLLDWVRSVPRQRIEAMLDAIQATEGLVAEWEEQNTPPDSQSSRGISRKRSRQSVGQLDRARSKSSRRGD